MVENGVATIRETLVETAQKWLEQQDLKDDVGKDMTLRAPKEERWGDLCTNLILLLCQEDKSMQEQAFQEISVAVKLLPAVQDVTLSDSGYLNIRLVEDYWLDRLALILTDFKAFSAARSVSEGQKLVLTVPPETRDLVSARQVWNAQILQKLGIRLGWDVQIEEGEILEQRGFYTETAISKCTEQAARMAVLSNGSDFSINFSPVLAVDRSYDNPVFSLPYAHARIQSLLERVTLQTDGEPSLLEAGSGFDFPIEQKIARFICEWPERLEQCLRNADIIHLTSFLHEVTLLFFRLVDQMRPQSSDYLTEDGRGAARQLLFRAIDKLICEGLALLEFDIAEEFI